MAIEHEQTFDHYHPQMVDILNHISKVIIGKQHTIELTLVAILAQGHVLLEDVPGVGKTMLVRALAKTLGCTFKRVQFTPDLLPSDVTGVSIFNQKEMSFQFLEGPVFAHIVLADEINRTSPKTQSSLLEAMEEGEVTVDGETRQLPQPFIVMATQNPIEYEGTFPLPEAQLDRFIMKLKIGYPDEDQELDMLSRLQYEHPIDTIEPLMSIEQLLQYQQEVRNIHMDESLKKYIISLVRQTREHPSIYLGASPRSSLALLRVSQALAFIRGRDYVVPDDVKQLVMPVFNHRIILHSDARFSGVSVEKVMQEILLALPVPDVQEFVK